MTTTRATNATDSAGAGALLHDRRLLANLADGQHAVIRRIGDEVVPWVIHDPDGRSLPYAEWSRASPGAVVGWTLCCSETHPTGHQDDELPLSGPGAGRVVDLARLRRAPGPVADDLERGWVHVADTDVDLAARPDVAAHLERLWRAHVEHADTIARVAAAAEQVARAGTALDDAVAAARAARRSWTDIGTAAGIRRQSARERWKHLDPPPEGET